MDHAGGTRATAAAAVMAGAVGLAVSILGAIRNQPAHSLTGICITMIALTALVLRAILGNRLTIADTRDERRDLAIAQGQAIAERDKYFAAQAALEVEQGRLNRDMAAERAAQSARLKVERAAMAAEFEERRAALIAETMEATVLMIQDGKLTPVAPTKSKVIQLREHQQRHPDRERSREHGVVGP